MKIWLDDERPAPEGWTHCIEADEAIALMAALKRLGRLNRLTHMSFDHDLADVHYEMTGYDVLLWMIENEVWPTHACHIHTQNSVRGPIMADMVNRYGPYGHKTVHIPYTPPYDEVVAALEELGIEPNPEGA